MYKFSHNEFQNNAQRVLQETFSKRGKLLRCELKEVENAAYSQRIEPARYSFWQCQGFAFVDYERDKDGEKAIKDLDGVMMWGSR